MATPRRGPVDARLALPAAACWVVTTLLLGSSWRASAELAVVAGALALATMRARRMLGAGLLLGIAVGAGSTALHVRSLHMGPVAQHVRSAARADLQMTLTRDPVSVTSRSGFRFVLASATVTAVDGQADRAPVTVLAHGSSWLGLLPGQRLHISDARLQAPRHGDPVAAAVVARSDPVLLGRPPPWQRAAGRVRRALRVATGRLPPDEAGLVPGLVIGDTAAMPPDLTAAFRTSGLTHLNAVSGENVAVLLATVGAVLRRTGLGRALRAVTLLAALVSFVVLARPSPSVLRAAVMGAVVVVGVVAGRRGSPLPVLSAAVLGLLVVDPFLARTIGFALSVLATAAIILAAPSLTERLSRRMPEPLAAAIAVPTVAQLACTPVLVAVFGQLTPWAIPANVLAAPAVAPATVAGVLCAAVAVPLPWLASALAWLAAAPAWWLAHVARTMAGLPGAGLGS